MSVSNDQTAKKYECSLSKKIIIAMLILFVIIVALYFLLRGESTTVKNNTTTADASSLICTASDAKNTVFDTRGAIPANYKAEVLFYNDSLDTLTYTYTGTYSDQNIKSNIEPYISADINEYLSQFGLSAFTAFASYSSDIVDNDLQIRISIQKNQMQKFETIAASIGLSDENVAPNGLKDFKAAYSRHGFICKEKDY